MVVDWFRSQAKEYEDITRLNNKNGMIMKHLSLEFSHLKQRRIAWKVTHTGHNHAVFNPIIYLTPRFLLRN